MTKWIPNSSDCKTAPKAGPGASRQRSAGAGGPPSVLIHIYSAAGRAVCASWQAPSSHLPSASEGPIRLVDTGGLLGCVADTLRSRLGQQRGVVSPDVVWVSGAVASALFGRIGLLTQPDTGRPPMTDDMMNQRRWWRRPLREMIGFAERAQR